MRFPLLLACATLLASTIISAGAADVWIEGRWVNLNGQHQWQPGYWQGTTIATTAPSAQGQVWVEGRWAQGANGWVWLEGHYETPPSAPQQVVVQRPVIVQSPCPPPQQVIVVERPCPPTVVIGATYGYGYHRYRPFCAPRPMFCRPAPVYCPPARRGVGVHVSLPPLSLSFR